MKIAAKTKDCFLIVNAKASGGEKIDERELARFSNVNLRGFLKPKLVKKNTVDYTGPVGISVADFLRRGVSKRDFFYVVEHTVAAIQKLQANEFPMYHLVMDLRYIYINGATKELQFIYLPSSQVLSSGGILGLFQAIVNLAKPIDEEDTTYVQRFDAFMKNLRPLNLELVEQFVYHEDRTVVHAIRKNNAGQSGYITNGNKHHTESHAPAYTNPPAEPVADVQYAPAVEEDDDLPTMILEEEEIPTGILEEEDEATDILIEEDDEATGILDEDEDDLRTVCISDQDSAFYAAQHTEFLSVTRAESHWEEDDQPTGLLIEEDDEATDILVDEDDDELRTICITSTEYETPITPVHNTEGLSDAGAVPLWEEDDEATGLLMEEEPQPEEVVEPEKEVVVNTQPVAAYEAPVEEEPELPVAIPEENKKDVRTPVRVVVRKSAPAAEPAAEPVVEPVVAPVVEPVVAPVVEPVVAPVVEPVVAPVVEPVVAPVVEPVVAPVVEPVVAPVAEPVVKPAPAVVPTPVYTEYPDPDDAEGTALLVEQEASQPVKPANVKKNFPVLRRVSTNEEININKPVFRIGKEKSYVDYFVNNNNAVSRSHADIVTRAKGCFVVDLNSKNHTYINGAMIPSHMEVAINDGDTLRLGNEEFIFMTSSAEKKIDSCPRCHAPVSADARFCNQCGYRIN